MTGEDYKALQVDQRQVHVTWWDNFSKVYAFQKADMSTTKFTLCLWTVCGIQRQSLPTQAHVVGGNTARRLMSVEDFKVTKNPSGALPADLLNPRAVAEVRDAWLGRFNKVHDYWSGDFRARDVNRVPLKLAPSRGDLMPENAKCVRR